MQQSQNSLKTRFALQHFSSTKSRITTTLPKSSRLALAAEETDTVEKI
jgi:hypothetical protein